MVYYGVRQAIDKREIKSNNKKMHIKQECRDRELRKLNYSVGMIIIKL